MLLLVPPVQGMYQMKRVSMDSFDGCTSVGKMWIELLLGWDLLVVGVVV